MNKMWKGQAFTIAHADDGQFEGQGLRAFFEYRQLGIREATAGKYGAHVIRAVPGRHSEGAWHTHDLDFQMVYVLKGWVVFEYEGQGEHIRPHGQLGQILIGRRTGRTALRGIKLDHHRWFIGGRLGRDQGSQNAEKPEDGGGKGQRTSARTMVGGAHGKDHTGRTGHGPITFG